MTILKISQNVMYRMFIACYHDRLQGKSSRHKFFTVKEEKFWSYIILVFSLGLMFKCKSSLGIWDSSAMKKLWYENLSSVYARKG